MLKANPHRWENLLYIVEFSNNRSRHSAHQLTSFEVVFGRNPLTNLDMVPRPLKNREHLDVAHRAEHVPYLYDYICARSASQLHERPSFINMEMGPFESLGVLETTPTWSNSRIPTTLSIACSTCPSSPPTPSPSTMIKKQGCFL